MARNRCGYCGKLGHNRRSCPQLTSDLKQSYETAKMMVEETAQTNMAHQLYGEKILNAMIHLFLKILEIG